MNFLTWNLGKRWEKGAHSFDALDLACRHLSKLQRRRMPFVAAFQECPEDDHEIRKKIPNGYVHGNVDRVIVSSSPLKDGRDRDRFVAARTTIEGHDLAVISYHGVDHRSRGEPTQRGGRSSELRWLIDDYCGTGNAIILGDFNALPADPEVQNRWCFAFALNDKEYHETSHGRARAGFKVVVPSGHQGTYYWKPEGMEPVWQVLDFVVTSDHLASRTKCEVSLKVAGVHVVNSSSLPSMSDHLPVLGSIDFIQGAQP